MKKSLLLAALLTTATAMTAFAQEAAPAEKRYHMEGKIQQIRPASHTATIDHKAIQGYMSAMAMPYTFKDSAELAKLKVGDYITADLVITGGKGLVEKVVVVKDTTAKK
jgi:Cu/Ag efflux protein CusF